MEGQDAREWEASTPVFLADTSPCVFHRNVEVPSRYARIYEFLPTCLRWAGMTAFASHHVWLALRVTSSSSSTSSAPLV